MRSRGNRKIRKKLRKTVKINIFKRKAGKRPPLTGPLERLPRWSRMLQTKVQGCPMVALGQISRPVEIRICSEALAPKNGFGANQSKYLLQRSKYLLQRAKICSNRSKYLLQGANPLIFVILMILLNISFRVNFAWVVHTKSMNVTWIKYHN